MCVIQFHVDNPKGMCKSLKVCSEIYFTFFFSKHVIIDPTNVSSPVITKIFILFNFKNNLWVFFLWNAGIASYVAVRTRREK